MGSVFQFKEFDVDQQDCAMKINTDGVLLAAQVSLNPLQSILDIGTGTGVMALMLAQRFPNAQVDALEIEEAAASRADLNFKNSIFSQQLSVFHTPFQQFQTEKKYDLIISNPPFYTHSLKNPDPKKTLARHTDMDFFEALLAFAKQYLQVDGSLQLILPSTLADELVARASVDFYLHSETLISSFPGEAIIRKMIDLRLGISGETLSRHMAIYKEKGVYSAEYTYLLKPYFLAY